MPSTMEIFFKLCLVKAGGEKERVEGEENGDEGRVETSSNDDNSRPRLEEYE